MKQNLRTKKKKKKPTIDMVNKNNFLYFEVEPKIYLTKLNKNNIIAHII